ncbi:MAG TPA: hypothetical protein VIM85_04475 [Pseudomonadales bacterium]
MTEPKCPDCAVQGINHLVSKDSTEHSKKRDPWFYVVYCNQCGHVYGVFAKHVMADVNQTVFNLSR